MEISCGMTCPTVCSQPDTLVLVLLAVLETTRNQGIDRELEELCKAIPTTHMRALELHHYSLLCLPHHIQNTVSQVCSMGGEIGMDPSAAEIMNLHAPL